MRTITDFMDMDFDQTIQLLKLNLNLQSNLLVAKIYSYTYKTEISYAIIEMDNLYEWLDEFIQCQDCKNGCEIREDNSGRYFSILGSNRYNRETDEFIATDEVKIYFKNYEW